jgi:hypothetical protein
LPPDPTLAPLPVVPPLPLPSWPPDDDPFDPPDEEPLLPPEDDPFDPPDDELFDPPEPVLPPELLVLPPLPSAGGLFGAGAQLENSKVAERQMERETSLDPGMNTPAGYGGCGRGDFEPRRVTR